MTLKSKEHYDLMDSFEKNFSHLRLDREIKEYWPLGRIYQNGDTNHTFSAYRIGYAAAKSIYQ